MIDQLLQSIGLSRKETQMYITLLRSGTQPISYLAKKAGLNRGTGYVVLHTLLDKGLVTKIVKRGVQYFSPLEPQQLVTYVDHREKALGQAKQGIQSAMGQFISLMNPLTSKPKIEFFDGQEGARIVLDRTLKSQEKILRSFLSIADIIDFLGADYFSEYTARRITQGLTLHALRTREKDREAFRRDERSKTYVTNKKDKRVIHHIPDDLAFPMTIYIFDTTLAVISSKDEGFSLLIESKEMTNMMKKIFDLLWLQYQ